MIARLGKVEIRQIDSLKRQQLINILIEFRECGALEFNKPWLEQLTTDHLRLLLLAARLYRALRAGAARSQAGLRTT
jgi:hypothetical protein